MSFKLLRFGLFAAVMGLANTLLAAVIYSTCPVPLTEQKVGALNLESSDRFHPDEFRLKIRSYSKEFPKALRYTRWLFSSQPDSSNLRGGDADAAKVGLWFEDLELINALAAEEDSCHDERNPATQAVAIFPFALRSTDAQGKNSYRVRYKVCEYYVDADRQLPLENACRVVGREQGYSFEELRARFDQLNLHVKESKDGLEKIIVGAGLLAALPTFRSIRFLKAGSMTSLAVSLVPAGVAYYAVRENWTDELVRNIVDFKDANEVALVGDLTTNVGINMPMEDFMSYFSRYLESMN